jgi:hypothetical protein
MSNSNDPNSNRLGHPLQSMRTSENFFSRPSMTELPFANVPLESSDNVLGHLPRTTTLSLAPNLVPQSSESVANNPVSVTRGMSTDALSFFGRASSQDYIMRNSSQDNLFNVMNDGRVTVCER